MSLIKNILKLKRKNFIFFTTPSHSQNAQFESVLGKKYFRVDFSEIDELDNLNTPRTSILELEKELQEIYDSSYTKILTNGSTQGILALMLATLEQGDKVLCATNCHKSVHNGLILCKAEPIWIYPSFIQDYGVYGSISANSIENAILENPDAKCLIITNPTYDGIISDLTKISELCKQHNILLIVDEAHGALWNFDKSLGTPAILSGADASVQSLHKTCGCINPAALLHISKNSCISKQKIVDSLQLISTTSPSFALLCNVEETISFLNSKKGKKRIEKLINNITQIINKIKKLKNIEILQSHNDITKILIKPLKISAEEFSNILYTKFRIECEIQHSNSLTFLCGFGTSEKNLKRLYKALKYINKLSNKHDYHKAEHITIPCRTQLLPPHAAFFSDFTYSSPKESIGKICAEIITTYPPGIPLLTYGEKISEDHTKLLPTDIKIRIVN